MTVSYVVDCSLIIDVLSVREALGYELLTSGHTATVIVTS